MFHAWFDAFPQARIRNQLAAAGGIDLRRAQGGRGPHPRPHRTGVLPCFDWFCQLELQLVNQLVN